MTNPTLNDLRSHKSEIGSHYQYRKMGADFSADMHENSGGVKKTQLLPPTKTHYIASKNLIGPSANKTSLKSPSSSLSASNRIDRRAPISHPIPKVLDSLHDNEDETANENSEIESRLINHKVMTGVSRQKAAETDPREYEQFFAQLVDHYIPCTMIYPTIECSKILVFFHANAEDIGQSYAFCKDVNEKLDCYVLLVEYPGYSVYPGNTTEQGVLGDIDPIYNFLTEVASFQSSDIILMGRSIGSGPATHFGNSYPVGGLVLISPFTSLKSAAQHNFTSVASVLVKQRFDNETKMAEIKCPCLFIHGKDDSLVPFTHSRTLYGSFRS
jgi:hypothetical protein